MLLGSAEPRSAFDLRSIRKRHAKRGNHGFLFIRRRKGEFCGATEEIAIEEIIVHRVRAVVPDRQHGVGSTAG
jgi:hypothetical protein